MQCAIDGTWNRPWSSGLEEPSPEPNVPALELELVARQGSCGVFCDGSLFPLRSLGIKKA